MDYRVVINHPRFLFERPNRKELRRAQSINYQKRKRRVTAASTAATTPEQQRGGAPPNHTPASLIFDRENAKRNTILVRISDDFVGDIWIFSRTPASSPADSFAASVKPAYQTTPEPADTAMTSLDSLTVSLNFKIKFLSLIILLFSASVSFYWDWFDNNRFIMERVSTEPFRLEYI